jgi:hypothetical protein
MAHALVSVLALLLSLSIAAQPAAKEEMVRRAVSAFQRAQVVGTSRSARSELADRLMAPLEPDKLSAEHLLALTAGGVLRDYSLRGAVIERLEKIAEGRDGHGAAAAIALVPFRPAAGPGPASVAGLAEALNHPGLAKLVQTASVSDVMGVMVQNLINRPDAVGLLLPELTAFFGLDLGLGIAPYGDSFLDVVERAKLTPGQLEPLRVAMAGAIKRCRQKLDIKEAVIDAAVAIGNSRAQVERMDVQEFRPHLAAQLDGIERRLKGGLGGRLVGQPAPQIDINWAQAGLPAPDTSALKGRISVLITWYRFEPAAGYSGTALIKELQTRYAGTPVDVVAVTSFLDGPLFASGRQVDPGGTRDQQLQRMTAIAKEHGLAGPLAVVDERRFGAAFGARGYNKVVVIDALGVVRAAGLEGSEPATVFQAIDALLPPPKPD